MSDSLQNPVRKSGKFFRQFLRRKVSRVQPEQAKAEALRTSSVIGYAKGQVDKKYQEVIGEGHFDDEVIDF